MKIGILLDPYGEKNPSGLGRWALEIVKNLIQSQSPDRFTVYVKKLTEHGGDASIEAHAAIKPLGVNSLWWSGGSRLDKKQDAYLFLTSIMPLTFFPKYSTVVALDFAYLEIGSSSLRQRAQSMFLYLLHFISFIKATKIVCISEDTRTKLHSHFFISRNKTVTIPLSAIDLAVPEEPISIPVKFFLFAGVLKERKNVAGVVRAFAELQSTNPLAQEYVLCIAGRTGGVYYSSLVALAEELGITDRIRFLGYVTDGQLVYLYRHATALVFPSFIEGFGMPVLEAMHAGLPVVTSKIGALAEVAGNSALLVDPYDPKDISSALSKMVSDPSVIEDLRARGYVRAQEFSWEKTAIGFRAVLHSLNT